MTNNWSNIGQMLDFPNAWWGLPLGHCPHSSQTLVILWSFFGHNLVICWTKLLTISNFWPIIVLVPILDIYWIYISQCNGVNSGLLVIFLTLEWLGHSNWSICSHWGLFCSYIFQFACVLYWEANLYYPRGILVRKGNSSNSRNGWQRGDWVLRVFKLEHLQPFRPILFLHISICMNFILGGHL